MLIIFFVKILFRHTKREDRTPKIVPIREKLISPSVPTKNPAMTTAQHKMTLREVVIFSKTKLDITLFSH